MTRKELIDMRDMCFMSLAAEVNPNSSTPGMKQVNIPFVNVMQRLHASCCLQLESTTPKRLDQGERVEVADLADVLERITQGDKIEKDFFLPVIESLRVIAARGGAV